LQAVARFQSTVRIIAATNRDLAAAVTAGTFRQDMFYRLSVFPVRMPSRRERAEDIPLLVEYLIDRYAQKAGKKITSIKNGTLEMLQAYDWPGNIRELQNIVERAVILSRGELFSVHETWLKPESPRLPGTVGGLAASLADREREVIEAALAESRGRIAGPQGAARKLGIPRQTLGSKITNFEISKSRFKTQAIG
jgi:formate hydrogenlyase transcriptional activator